MRGNRRDYDRWAELGNPTWDYDTAIKYMKKSEANQRADFVEYKNGKYHSDKGPMPIDNYGELDPDAKIFYEAGQERGINFVENINADVELGYVNAQAFISNGRRYSTAKSFLVPAKNRTNLHIVKHAHVQKILIDDNNVVNGVEFLYKNDQLYKATIRKEVVLSAGAVSSPQLLMLSGIGPQEHLKKHNIPVKHNSAVGKNLLDHVISIAYFQFHRSSQNSHQEAPTDVLDAIYNLAIHNSGELKHLGATQMIAMLNTVNGTGYPDVELHFLYAKKNTWKLPLHIQSKHYNDDIEKHILQANAESDIGIIWITLLQPKSTGFVELKSASAEDKPHIVPNYFKEEEDMATMLRALKQQISFTDTETYRKHEGEFLRIPLKECDKYEFKSDDYLRCYIRHFSATLYHPGSMLF